MPIPKLVSCKWSFDLEKWKKSNQRTILKAHVFHYHQVDVESPLGKKGTFDLVTCPRWANVIALTKNKEVILVKQYRIGTDEITLETPGGMVPAHEDILQGVRRELNEETGFDSNRIEELGTVSVNPAFMNNHCHLFVAYDCEEKMAQSLDPMEEIEIVKVPLTHIMPMIDERKIHHSLVVAAFGLFFAKGLQLKL
jgi:ADP-ribose pyrophosphatase